MNTNFFLIFFLLFLNIDIQSFACDSLKVKLNLGKFENLLNKDQGLVSKEDSVILNQLYEDIVPCINAVDFSLANRIKKSQFGFSEKFQDYDQIKSLCESLVNDTVFVAYLVENDALGSIGFWAEKQSDQALVNQLIGTVESLFEGERSKNLELMFANHYYISHLQVSIGDYQSAINTCLKTVDIVKLLKMKPEEEAYIYQNIAYIYYKRDILDSALYYMQRTSKIINKALQTVEPTDTVRQRILSADIDDSKGKMARISLKLKEYEGLAPIFKKELKTHILLKSVHPEKIALLNISETYVGMQEFDSAFLYLDKFMSKKDHCANCKKRYYEIQSNAYVELGQMDSAKIAFRKQMQISDSIQREAKGNMGYKVLMDRRLDFVDHLTKLYETEKKSHLLARGVVVLLLMILFILVYFIYRLRKKNANIFRQKNYINKALREKTFLLQEVHHRVNNNLQLMSSIFYLDSLKYENSVISEFLNTNQSKIFVLSLAHSMLGENNEISRVSVNTYIEKLIKYFERSVDVEIDFTIDAEENFLIDDITTLGLYINELLYMSLSHIYNTEHVKIKIEIEKEENGQFYFLEYTDDYTFQRFDVEGGLIKLLNEAIRGELVENEVFDTGRICKLKLKYGDNLHAS
ncbi:MAG: sensor histidine kinase [Flavobacteriales bacterium]|jgi:two-component sensor histidine kinase|nr:sensor histidine kinase [Flavobacteriales bacterium]